MKPGDFFLGLRQLLGVLVPGAVWLTAISFIIEKESPLKSFSGFNAQQVGLVVVTAFVLGYAARGPAFSAGIWIGNLLPRWLGKQRSRALQPSVGTQRLLTIVLKKVPKQEGASASEKSVPLYEPDEIPTWAKYSILGRSELSRRLDEIEAEINLYATMVVPLLLLLASHLIFIWRSEVNWTVDQMVIEVSLVLISISFASRASARRDSELRDIYLMFLALTDSAISSKEDE